MGELLNDISAMQRAILHLAFAIVFLTLELLVAAVPLSFADTMLDGLTNEAVSVKDEADSTNASWETGALSNTKVANEQMGVSAAATKETIGASNVGTTQKLATAVQDTPGVVYSAPVENIGWQDAIYDEATAGTEGQSLRIEALLQLKLNATNCAGYSGGISFGAHVQDIGWLDWACDGENADTDDNSRRSEVIQSVLVKKAGTKSASKSAIAAFME